MLRLTTVFLLLLAGCHRTARDSPPSVAWSPCGPAELQPARCGELTVPEDWAATGGRRISLRLMILDATAGKAQPDPIYVITGGPGQAATSEAAQFHEQLAPARQHRALVLIDQRGTGGSNELRCDSEERTEGEAAFVELGRRCLERVSPRADVRQYATPSAVRDLEAVRTALGHGRINLDAGSYGTRVALEYLKRYGANVRTAVLRGVSPTRFKNPLPFPRAGQEALNAVILACAAQPACHAAYPSPKEDLQRTLARLEAAPAEVTLEGGTKLKLTRARFAALVHLMLLLPDLVEKMPFLLRAAAAGELTAFAQLSQAWEQAVIGMIAYGMQLAVVCPEDVAQITGKEIARETAGTFLGDQQIRDYQAICREWPKVELPPDFFEPTRSDVPTLILSGAHDASTPLHFATEVARDLSRSRHVVMPNAAHIARAGCQAEVVAKFIDQAQAETLATDCLTRSEGWKFYVP